MPTSRRLIASTPNPEGFAHFVAGATGRTRTGMRSQHSVLTDVRQTATLVPMADSKVHTMSVREHVRGGYREVTDAPTIVLNGNEIAGVWYPGTTGINVMYPGNHALMVGPDMRPYDPVAGERIQVHAIRPVPKPTAARKPRR